MTSAPADASASYAAEVARLLWPDPWEAPYVTRVRHRPGLPHRDAYLFPSERRPRLLVGSKLDAARPERRDSLRRAAAERDLPYHAVSAATGEGIAELIGAVAARLEPPEPPLEVPS